MFESTVYPGVTEEFVYPLEDQEKANKDGYSPERINPGDKKTQLKIKK